MKPIKTLLKRGLKLYDEKYDHLMLSTLAFKHLTGNEKVTKSGLAKLRRRLKLKQIEICDQTYFEKSNSGNIDHVRVLPFNKVILSSIKSHNNPDYADFANGQTTESFVAALISPELCTASEYGPTSFFTGNKDLNPPEMAVWSVVRGFPRRHVPAMSAVLTLEGLQGPEYDENGKEIA